MELVRSSRSLLVLGVGFVAALILSACGAASLSGGLSAGGSASGVGTSTTPLAAPTVTMTAGAASVVAGETVSLQWQSSNAQSCTASGGWSGTQLLTGTFTSGALSSSTTFTLTCSGTGGSTAQSVSVAVQAPASDAPTVALTALPTTVAPGGSATLAWSTSGATRCSASGGWMGSVAVSGSESTDAINKTTEFALTCDGPGGSATQTATVSVSGIAPTIQLSATPTTVASGSTSTLAWKSSNATSCSASGDWSGAKSSSGTQSSGALTSGSTYTLSCTGPGGTAVQSVTVSVGAPAPTVALSASPSSLTSGASATLTWSAKNATSCTASGNWAGTEPASGSQSTGILKSTSTYVLTCKGTGGTASQSTTVTVEAAAPTVSLSVGPSAIARGSSSTINWVSVNATSCTAGGAWSGSRALSGTLSTGALNSTSTYTLTCTGTGGAATQSATVTVSATPSTTVSFSASPSTIANGSAANLAWTANNATACVASGAWSGNKAVNGSQTTGALTSQATYTLTCTGTGGSSAAQTVNVSVSPPVPTVSLSANPSSVASGSSSSLSWSATNATACSASGGWSGAKSVNGSQATAGLSATTTYTLTCTGVGGTASQSAIVSVSAPTPVIGFSSNPSTVAKGGNSTLLWSATNATSCTASGGWSGSKGLSGSQTTGGLSENTSYMLSCTGSGGTASQVVTVSVTDSAPTVILSAIPTTVKSGTTSALTWSSTNATSCTASGAWTGAKATTGTAITPTLTSTSEFTLTCSGTGGSASQTATVTVSTPAPTISFSANPTSVTQGGTSTLSWTSTNTTSCTASGGWSGTLGTNGTQKTATLNAATSYTLSCSGNGGKSAQSVTVAVTAPTGTASLTWTAPTLNTNGSKVTPLVGYLIFYGTSQSALSKSIDVSGARSTSYEITGLAPGTWYFAVAAEAADGAQSPRSAIGSKTL